MSNEPEYRELSTVLDQSWTYYLNAVKLISWFYYRCGEGGLGLCINGKQLLHQVKFEIWAHVGVHGKTKVQRAVSLKRREVKGYALLSAY